MQRSISIIVWFITATLLFSSCSKDNGIDCNNINPNLIDWKNLAVGQINTYVGFNGEDYFLDTEESFAKEYRADTLVVEIIEETGDGFLVRESLSPGSVSLNNPESILFNADSISVYLIEILNGKLVFKLFPDDESPNSSHLLFRNVPGFNLPVANIEENATEIKGWKTTLPYCECFKEAYANNYEWCIDQNEHINIIVDNEGMQVDGPGFTYLFSENTGIIQTTFYNWWTQSGHGWELLKD